MFYNRITGFTLPFGGGVTLAALAAQAKVAERTAELVSKHPEKAFDANKIKRAQEDAVARLYPLYSALGTSPGDEGGDELATRVADDLLEKALR
jgi:hypothetical protein